MTVGSPLGDHEFVSDSFQTGNINADELKKEMDQLGVSDKMQDSDGTNRTHIDFDYYFEPIRLMKQYQCCLQRFSSGTFGGRKLGTD